MSNTATWAKRPGPVKKWKSLTTGNEFNYADYSPHGFGGVYRGMKDLPANEYPYTVITEKQAPLWETYR